MIETGDLQRDEFEQAFDVRRRSFGGGFEFGEWQAVYADAVAEGRALVARDGGRVVGAARILTFGQWWHGCKVAMGGVGGVVVAPEARGRGVGRALMTAVLARIRERGDPLSVLYPATVPLYRSLGWELAGRQRIVEIPAAAVRLLAEKDAIGVVRRCQPGDGEAIMAAINGAHARANDCGPVEWELRDWERELADPDLFTYLCDDGYVGYGFEEAASVLDVSHLVGGSEATIRALWALVGSGSSVASTVRACVSPNDPLPWLGAEQLGQVHKEQWWMLRVVDPVPAFARRGYPVHAAVSLRLRVTDRAQPDHDGDYVLSVVAGSGVLERAEPRTGGDPLHVDANGLAALYAGVPAATRRRAGLVSGGTTADDDAADAVLATSAFSLDYF